MTRLWSVVLIAGSLAGAALSYVAYANDQRTRIPAAQFAQKYTIDIRRPEVSTSLHYAPSGDFAADLVADVTLRDVVVPVSLRDMKPSMRATWLAAVERYDDQMSGASDLLLDAIAQRPGWPYHQSLLGQIVYARDARRLSADLVGKYRRWYVPLTAGALSAESDDSLWESLALAYVQTWTDLHDVHSRTAPAVFRRAFADPDFVGAAFGNVIDVLGGSYAARVLPDRAASLREAFLHFARTGNLELAWQVSQRWERAEANEQSRDADRIDDLQQIDTADHVAVLCRKWVYLHGDALFAATSVPNALRVLAAWPAGDSGAPNDPHATLQASLAGPAGVQCDAAAAALQPAVISLRSQETRTVCNGATKIAFECSNSEIVEVRQNAMILGRLLCDAGRRQTFSIAAARAPYVISSRVLARARAGA